MKCNICNKDMHEGEGFDPLALNCGGDCVECMATCGDIDCQRTVNQVKPGTYLDVDDDSAEVLASYNII